MTIFFQRKAHRMALDRFGGTAQGFHNCKKEPEAVAAHAQCVARLRKFIFLKNVYEPCILLGKGMSIAHLFFYTVRECTQQGGSESFLATVEIFEGFDKGPFSFLHHEKLHIHQCLQQLQCILFPFLRSFLVPWFPCLLAAFPFLFSKIGNYINRFWSTSLDA